MPAPCKKQSEHIYQNLFYPQMQIMSRAAWTRTADFPDHAPGEQPAVRVHPHASTCGKQGVTPAPCGIAPDGTPGLCRGPSGQKYPSLFSSVRSCIIELTSSSAISSVAASAMMRRACPRLDGRSRRCPSWRRMTTPLLRAGRIGRRLSAANFPKQHAGGAFQLHRSADGGKPRHLAEQLPQRLPARAQQYLQTDAEHDAVAQPELTAGDASRFGVPAGRPGRKDSGAPCGRIFRRGRRWFAARRRAAPRPALP